MEYNELIESGVLGGLILAGVQLLKRAAPNLSGQIATIIVSVVFGGIAMFVVDGIGILNVLVAFAGQVLAYDFAVKPIKGEVKKEKDPPVGGGGSGPIP